MDKLSLLSFSSLFSSLRISSRRCERCEGGYGCIAFTIPSFEWWPSMTFVFCLSCTSDTIAELAADYEADPVNPILFHIPMTQPEFWN